MSRALINVPAKARKGEVIQIRTLVQHEMETGFRPLPNGGFAPRLILRRFECIYDGETVFAADLHPAISANPYLAFRTVATTSGEHEPASSEQACGEADHEQTHSPGHRKAARGCTGNFVIGNFKSGDLVRGNFESGIAGGRCRSFRHFTSDFGSNDRTCLGDHLWVREA